MSSGWQDHRITGLVDIDRGIRDVKHAEARLEVRGSWSGLRCGCPFVSSDVRCSIGLNTMVIANQQTIAFRGLMMSHQGASTRRKEESESRKERKPVATGAHAYTSCRCTEEIAR